MLLLPNAQAADTDFRFQQCVKVVHGFYRGCNGMVVDYTDNSHNIDPLTKKADEDAYEVSLLCKGAGESIKTFKVSDIRPLKGKCNAN